MATVSAIEPVLPSRRLRSAATAERERMARELERLDARALALSAELAKIESTRGELREQLALLARFAHEPEVFATSGVQEKEVHLRAVEQDAESVPATAVLRGARIRELAVFLLLASPEPARPVHYERWYQLVRDAGYVVAGKNPHATFLTQISRSPVVRKVDRPGTYALDFEAPARLRRHVLRLQQELTLAGAEPPASSADELAEARHSRTRLATELQAAERALEEALRALTSASEAPKHAATPA
jgi:hypothetical protein